MARITGIGGVFFKANDPKGLTAWYAKHLGLVVEPWGGAILRWTDDKKADGGATVWNAAAADTKWFAPSEASFMINYRVDDLDGILAQAREGGAIVVGEPTSDDNGRFAHIIDPAGNKVELWEPK